MTTSRNFHQQLLTIYNFVYAAEILRVIWTSIQSEIDLDFNFSVSLNQVSEDDVIEHCKDELALSDIPTYFKESFIERLKCEDWRIMNIPKNEKWRNEQLKRVKQMFKAEKRIF